MKQFHFLTLLVVVTFMSSCDSFYQNSFIVTNETDKTINLEFHEVGSGSNQYDTILSSETETIFIFSLAGKCKKTYGDNNCPPDPIDSLNDFIKFSYIKMDTIEIKTDFNNINLWTFIAKDGLGTYKATIRNSDF